MYTLVLGSVFPFRGYGKPSENFKPLPSVITSERRGNQLFNVEFILPGP